MPLWTVRGIHFAAVLSVFGASVFKVAVAPHALAQLNASAATLAEQRTDRLLWLGLLLALLSSGWWFSEQAAAISGATTLTDWIGALRPVLLETHFGHLMLLRWELLLGAAIAVLTARRRWRFVAAALFTALAAAVQVLISHGAAVGGQRGAAIVAAEVAHVLAAGIWLGSLPPLLVILVLANPSAAAVASRKFSPIGIGCVLLLALSAPVLAILLAGGLPGLLGTDYGHIILVKLGLFLCLIALAAGNRFVFTSGLTNRDPALSRSRLVWSIAIECALGLLVVLAAAKLSSLPPGMHEHHHHEL